MSSQSCDSEMYSASDMNKFVCYCQVEPDGRIRRTIRLKIQIDEELGIVDKNRTLRHDRD